MYTWFLFPWDPHRSSNARFAQPCAKPRPSARSARRRWRFCARLQRCAEMAGRGTPWRVENMVPSGDLSKLLLKMAIYSGFLPCPWLTLDLLSRYVCIYISCTYPKLRFSHFIDVAHAYISYTYTAYCVYVYVYVHNAHSLLPGLSLYATRSLTLLAQYQFGAPGDPLMNSL